MSNEVNESIEVVSESVSDPDASDMSTNLDSQPIRAIRETLSMGSNSVMTVNEENECFKLENELKSTRKRLAEVTAENASLRRQLDERRSTSKTARRQSENDFVDVNSLTLAEKIEHHLGESDGLLIDEDHFKPAMEYLIKNLWSIIAHEYGEESLQSTRLIRDSLLVKIDRINELIGCARTAQVLEAELESLKKDTCGLRDKVIKQNQLIKSLVGSIQNSATNNTPNSSSHQSEFLSSSIQVLNGETTISQQKNTATINATPNQRIYANHSETVNDENTNQNESNNTTPGVSPSQSFTNHLNILLNKRQIQEVRSIAPSITSTVNEYSDDSDTLQHEQTGPQSGSSNQAPGFLLHGMNDSDFIGVTRENEPIPMLDKQNLAASAAFDDSRLFLNGQSPSSPVYQCPSCKTTVDPKTMAWEMFMRHVRDCDVTRQNVCIFCLRIFPKNDSYEFEEHVQSHMDSTF